MIVEEAVLPDVEKLAADFEFWISKLDDLFRDGLRRRQCFRIFARHRLSAHCRARRARIDRVDLELHLFRFFGPTASHDFDSSFRGSIRSPERAAGMRHT